MTSFPTPDSVTGCQKVTPDPQSLIEDQVGEDYIVRTQRQNYPSEAGWRSEAERPGYIQANRKGSKIVVDACWYFRQRLKGMKRLFRAGALCI